jgi:uncharacterized GH25 family protein
MQRTTRTFTALALAAASLAAHLGAQAHQVWIEQDAQGAKLYFGEFGENLREASPGLLDKFVKPVAHRLSAKGEQAAEVQKTPNGFGIAARAGKGESIVAEETAYPASERKEGEKVTRSIYVPAARLVTDFAKYEPKLTLDLVPTGQQDKDGVEIQAFYKGQPLPKAKVVVVTSAGWQQEHHTNEAGKLNIRMPWRGTYVLELSHRDNAGGERTGADGKSDRFDRASYVTSLTVTQPTGLPALPASPAAAPNKAN